jgi:hypothetical protein
VGMDGPVTPTKRRIRLSLLFILSAAECLGYTTNVSRHELCVRPLLQEASVVRADGKNRRDKIPGFPHPRIDFPVPIKKFPVT